MANDHTLYVRNGVVTSAPQANQNPSVAQAPNQDSAAVTAVKATVLIQLGKQVFNQTVSMVGYTTGDYELQEQIEFVTKAAAIGVGLFVAPIPVLGGLTVSTGFELYALNIKQRRAQFKQAQNQILTGAISVNGGRY